jgi:hypothetical protein
MRSATPNITSPSPWLHVHLHWKTTTYEAMTRIASIAPLIYIKIKTKCKTLDLDLDLIL